MISDRLRDALHKRLSGLGDLTIDDQKAIIALVDAKITQLEQAAADPTFDLWMGTEMVLARIQTEEVIALLRVHRRTQDAIRGIIADGIRFGLSFALV